MDDDIMNDMSCFIEESKNVPIEAYKAEKCYCGNKFLKLRVKAFNFSCFVHDFEYDVIIKKISKAKHDCKKLADLRFLKRNLGIANEFKGIKRQWYKMLAHFGYTIVRMLPDSYVR